MVTEAYVTFLVLGVLLVVIDGQVIYRSGRRYMESSEAATGNSMVRLVTMLFHLAMLGIVALLSIIDFGTNTPVTAVVLKVGVLLLLLAAAHGIAMAIIAHIRDEQLAQPIPPARGEPSGPVVNPVPGQRGREPSVSPSIEHRAERTDT